MNDLIAFCGLNFEEYEARKVAINDNNLREKIAKEINR